MGDSRWMDCPVIIPYLGGKFELSRVLIPMLAPHKRYIEVFAGGLSMFYRKNKVEWNVVNDKDNDIVNLYESIRTTFEEFKEHAYWLIKAREPFLRYRKEIHESKIIDIPDPERAAKYYYVIRNAFNRNINATISKNSDSWHTRLLNDLHYSRERLNNVLIENMDFEELHNKYPSREGDMWYLDPPYMVAGERGDYYFFDFDMHDHKRLAKMCQDINANKAKFMVSYDDREEVRELYKNFRIKVIKTIYAGQQHNRVVKNELVITNYLPAEQHTLFEEKES